ncbi:MATE family efflux transporter [Salirhabdus salicampi]|uniref:MATE family efflux transporter n=1 Tax=Salirhabdus salicampi TaxID=476102 RepID=UPI0020C48E7C|nr:MATE family efflux transporter [Salirhabdus salicampi]MCP8615309.1 MATE family efflux transporter [Salirhabdus salicampi]
MYEAKTYKDKGKLFLAILFPILITQIGIFAMNFFDTIMSGRSGPVDLAGVAIGSSLWLPIFTGVNGVLLALSPIVAQMLGSGEKKRIGEVVRQGIYLSIAIAIFIFLIGLFLLDAVLNMMNLEQDVQYIAKYYLAALSIGIVPLFIFNILRCFIDALGQTRITMMIILISLPLNIIFNYIFIFGKLGVPALGGVGAGLASALTYFVCLLISLFVIARLLPFSSYKIFLYWSMPSLKAWWEQLRIGIPIGFAIFFETSIFAAVTLLISVYDTTTIAAHQAAMNFQSMLYMGPLSISMALTIAVGFEVGAKRFKDAKQYSLIGIITAIGLAIIGSLFMYLFDDQIAKLYSNHPEVIVLTKQFLIYAIFFQLSDAFGAPIQGALRGYKDVNITSVMAFISYWIIGLPTGYIMANYTSLGPFGYWIGLITGLAAGAITLLFRLLHVQDNEQKLSA